MLITSYPLPWASRTEMTLFGMFLDLNVPQNAKNNIEKLAKYVWDSCSEERKLDIGARFGLFRKNAEITKKDATQRFLEIVNGLAYKDEDSLAGELIEKLEILKSVHFAWDNFYNEFPHARALKSSLPITAIIPRSARHLWVKVISICYIGNGLGYREGVDEAAIIYYEEYINNFTDYELAEFVHLFNDPEFTSIVNRVKPDERIRKLAKILKKKTMHVHVIRILDLIINSPHLMVGQITITSDYKNSLKNVPKLK